MFSRETFSVLILMCQRRKWNYQPDQKKPKYSSGNDVYSFKGDLDTSLSFAVMSFDMSGSLMLKSTDLGLASYYNALLKRRPNIVSGIYFGNQNTFWKLRLPIIL